MLKRLARLERTRNLVIIGFAVLMAVSLIIFYAPGRNNTRDLDPSRNTEVVAPENVAQVMLRLGIGVPGPDVTRSEQSNHNGHSDDKQ